MNALRIAARVALVLLGLSLACAACAHPRPRSAPGPSPAKRVQCRTEADDYLPEFAIRRLPTSPIDSIGILRRYLRDGCWASAIRTYYKNYQGRLAAWVVYVASDGHVYQGIVSNGRDTTELEEQRYVWALVFLDQRLQGSGPDTMDFRFSRRVVAYRRDPKLVLLLRGLGKVIGLDMPEEPQLADSTRALRLEVASASNDPKSQLYAAFGRFGLIENTEVQLSLAPVPDKHFPDPSGAGSSPPRPLHIYANLANARRNTFELGVLIGGTYGPPVRVYGDDLQVKSESPRGDANAYLIGVVNLPWLWRPVPLKRRWQRASVGLFGGTNLARGGLGDELALGLALGRVLGELGLDVGADWLVESTVERGRIVKRREPRLLFGFDFRL